jgi:MFS family permease
MNGGKRSIEVRSTYSLLIGGLMASFVAYCVFTWIADTSGSVGSWRTLASVLVGLGSAGLFMVAGMLLTERLPWLTSGLLFASGFTALWSIAVSFTVDSKWVVVTALGSAIALGVGLGWWRFGRHVAQGAIEASSRPSA